MIAWIIVILAILIAIELLAFNLWSNANPKSEDYPKWVYILAYFLLIEIVICVLLVFLQCFISF